MFKIDDPVSKKLALMSLLCAAMVCFIHIHPSPHGFGTWLLKEVLRDGICRIAVPFFFFASGYLLSAHANGNGWFSTELKKRVRTLVVPYASFCTIYLIFAACFSNLEINLRALLDGFGITSIYPPINAGHLWFVRCLFGFVLLSPVLIWCVQRFGLATLTLVGFVYFVTYTPWFPNFIFVRNGFSTQGLFFFCFGLWCWFHARTLWTELGHAVRNKLGIAFLLTGIFLIVTKLIAYRHGYGCRFGHLIEAVTIFAVLPGIWLILPAVNLPKYLVGMSFPIYCMHPIFITVIRRNTWGGGGFHCPTAFLCCITWLASVCASVLTALMLRKISKNAAAIFFGGR